MPSQAVAPFEIDKTGFGNACAWLTVMDVAALREPNGAANSI
ncbi:MAG: hypothetical protein PHT12_04490 [Patescibacteria group bacterium]|nr:hypothetical protein [Patescibacteria group bacterium]